MQMAGLAEAAVRAARLHGSWRRVHTGHAIATWVRTRFTIHIGRQDQQEMSKDSMTVMMDAISHFLRMAFSIYRCSPLCSGRGLQPS